VQESAVVDREGGVTEGETEEGGEMIIVTPWVCDRREYIEGYEYEEGEVGGGGVTTATEGRAGSQWYIEALSVQRYKKNCTI
jgi:hypothetical protein